MKFQVNRDTFSEAVSFAVKLLPQRTTLPILSGVLIEATDAGLTLSSFDYEVSAQTEIAAEVDEPRRTLDRGQMIEEEPGADVEPLTGKDVGMVDEDQPTAAGRDPSRPRTRQPCQRLFP